MPEDCKSKLDFFGDFQLSKNGFNFSFKEPDEPIVSFSVLEISIYSKRFYLRMHIRPGNQGKKNSGDVTTTLPEKTINK